MKLIGIIGKGSGKMGASVFVVNSGTQIVREYRERIANPNTEAQVAQRAKMKLSSQLAAALSNVIAIPRDGMKTPRNLFIKKNIGSVFYGDGQTGVHYENLQLTDSNLGLPAVTASYNGVESISVALVESAAASVDRVVYNLFRKSAEHKLQLYGSAVVSAPGADGTFPYTFPFVPNECVVYAYGMKDKNENAAAAYGDYQVTSGQDLAALFMNRSITTNDYALTRTRGVTLYQNPDIYPYGIEFDTASSSPTCQRIGSLELHRTLPVQSRMRGCLLDDDGQVVSYLPQNSWASADVSGASGQVMVEIPEHYEKFVTIGTKCQVWLSLVPQTGYKRIKRQYVSAYEAALDRDTLKLCSVRNYDTKYRGGNNNAAWDDQPQSLRGMPATNISLTDFRTYARNRKPASAEWNCMTYDIQKTLYWLFAVEYATLNTQAAWNDELSPEGYHQGGLGAGVTTINSAKWSVFNRYNPVIRCGLTDTRGNRSGNTIYSLPDAFDPGVTTAVAIPRYRGIENPFGHINKWADGILIQAHPVSEENVSKVYVCSNPADFSSSSVENYTFIGNLAQSNGYIKKVLFGEGGEIMSEQVGGSESTYFCDLNETSIPTSSPELRGVRFCGSGDIGSRAGIAYANSTSLPSIPHAFNGTRLTFIPEEN